jgi:CRISPR/Cas system-associated exonuclease Cas4 (RecB family)
MTPGTATPPAFSFSQSSLQDYADCPRRFQLRYLERLSYPAVESEPALENERRQREGQLFHRLVQQHRIGLPADRLTPLASTPHLQRWWSNYVGQDFGLDGCELHTELTVSAMLASHRLLAKYDLVAVRPDGKIMIYDWKTYEKRPKDEWMERRLQTRVYRLLMVRAGAALNGGRKVEPGQVEMIYWYASHPDEPYRFAYSPALYRQDEKYLAAMLGEIDSDRQFDLTPDERKCAYCPYRSYCARGVQAGENDDWETDWSASEMNFEQVQEIEY